MTVKILRGKPDSRIDSIVDALSVFQVTHKSAEITVYRQNSVSIRVRIVDSDFKGLSRTQRSEQVWPFFEALADEVQSEISTLLLLTPGEQAASFANYEFEYPVPSSL